MHVHRMSTVIVTAAAAATLAVAVIGCTDSGASRNAELAGASADHSQSQSSAPEPPPPESTAPTSTTTASPSPSSRRAPLDVMLLRAEDVPLGYSESPQDFSNIDNPFCDAAHGEIPSSTVKSQIKFQKSPFGPFISNSIATYNDVDAVFEGYVKAVQKCGRYTENRADGTAASGSFTETSFPTIGDRTYAASFTGAGAGFAYAGELVLVAKGGVASVIMILGTPTGDTTQLEAYARTVEERMS